MRQQPLLSITVFFFSVSACQGVHPTSAATATVLPKEAFPPGENIPTLVTIYQPPELPGFPKIDRHPSAGKLFRYKPGTIPTYDPDSDDLWQMDLRSLNLSGFDLRDSLDDLFFASFDDRTVWPVLDRMPPGFDWQQIREFGKNPGLNVRALHAEGITGKGIGIAVIDDILLVDHQEYIGQLRLYEEQGRVGSATMHGAAVSSIAAGKTTGVAPDADLYYVAADYCTGNGSEEVDFSCLAKAVRRILEINQQLPPDRRIRVLSMSIGWSPENKGYAEIQSAIQSIRDAGVFVICSSEWEIYGFQFHGLGRLPLADPDDVRSYVPGLWWAKIFYKAPDSFSDVLLVPMDSRTTASPTGNDEYVFYREGGWSWSIPYIAGMYALAAQVKPDITPDLFWSTALATGRTIEITHEGKAYSFGTILDPAALIHTLQGL
jgi:hypothetical protein